MDKITVTPNGAYSKRNCDQCSQLIYVELRRVITSNGVSQVYWFCKRHNGAINSPRINIQHEQIKHKV